MSLNHKVSVGQIIAFAITLSGLCVAIYFGTLIGSADFSSVLTILLIFAGAAYAVSVASYWLVIGFFWASCGFVVSPVGPTLNGVYVVIVLAIMFIISVGWQRRQASQAAEILQSYFKPFMFCLKLYLIYMAANAVLTLYYPDQSFDVSWQNLAKQNIDIYGGFLIIAIALKFSCHCRLPKNFTLWVAWILLLALLFNIVLRSFGMFVLNFGEVDTSLQGQTEVSRSVLYIPLINLTDNFYTLRPLAPLAALFGTAMLYTTTQSTLPAIRPLLCWLVILAGIAGALASGGRATLLLIIILVLCFLFYRRRYAGLFGVLTLGLLLYFGVLYSLSNSTVQLPMFIQRTVAFVPGFSSKSATDSIDSSSNWRWELAQRALEEWQSNSRTLLLGRGVYSYTASDVMAIGLDGYYGAMETSLRRGSTHSALTDLLLITGIIGTVLYTSVVFSLLYGIYRIMHDRARFDSISALCVIVLIDSVVVFLVSLFGGGFFGLLQSVLSACIIVLSAKHPICASTLQSRLDRSRP